MLRYDLCPYLYFLLYYEPLVTVLFAGKQQLGNLE